MKDTEAIEMMQAASMEIKNLRAYIARLEPKASAYDNLSIVLDLLPKRSQGMGEDVAWKLDRRIDEIKKAMAASDAQNG